jgi:hypothetical protein
MCNNLLYLFSGSTSRSLLHSQDFDKDALQKFAEVSGLPIVVTFDADPSNQKYLIKYFENAGDKVSFWFVITAVLN